MMVAADSQSDPRAGKLKRFSTDQQFMRRLFALSVVISAFISRVVLFTFLNGLRQEYQMGTRSPSQIAMRRIQSELADWLLDDRRPEGCQLESFEPLMSWVVVIEGPDAAPGMPKLYNGERFRLRVNFSDRYPLDPPEVYFIPPSPVHPHIYSNGHICLDILYDGDNGGWSPALTLSKVAISLRSMLASNTELKRPPGDQEYCARTCARSPKQTRWEFEDDTV